MKKKYARSQTVLGRWLAAALTAASLSAAHAQTTPGWTAALAASQPYSGTTNVLASVADGSGNVYVTGNFTGQVLLGSTTLVSAGGSDVFVAKWNVAAGTWTWAVRAGGLNFDGATALALSGTSLYLTGYTADDAAGSGAVAFGTQPLPGKASASSQDIFVAKLTDAGTAASFTWAINGGGGRTDQGTSLVVSGSMVYVAGVFVNDAANTQAVTFGALPLNGLSAVTTSNADVIVGKLTDAGSTASWTWVQAAGGTGADQGTSLAVSGTSVYVAGSFNNSAANVNNVTFGAVGAVSGLAASASDDAFVAKLTDAGSTSAFTWVRPAGGSGSDRATALAANSSGVYAAGYFNNNSSNSASVVFGAAGTLNGLASVSSQDLFVTKLTDAGSTGAFAWAQAAGGNGSDQANALVASGSALYVGSSVTNDALNSNAVAFGSLPVSGAGALVSADAVVARLTDAGSTASWSWVQVGGGNSLDGVTGLAMNGSSLYPVGPFSLDATFGTAAGQPLRSGLTAGSFYVGQLTEAPAGASASWTRVAQSQNGGAFSGLATAPSADGNVYVAGSFTGRPTLGSTTLTSTGSLDAFVAKWSPATGTWLWVLPAGGLGADQVSALAVNGTSVYAAGYLVDNANNDNRTRFGTLVANGKSTAAVGQDAYVAKLVDAGTSASWTWVQVAGGTGSDLATGLAVNGTSVYVAGIALNNAANINAVTFGTISLPGVAASASQDAFVAKLTDAGATASFTWAQAGGGTSGDQATGLAVSGTSVYVAGSFTNNAANANAVTFGTVSLPGLAATAGQDAFVAKLTDAGTTASFAWAQAAGGAGSDQATSLALNGTSVYVAGNFTNNAANANAVTFGTVSLPGFAATTAGLDAFVAKLTDAGATASFAWAQAGGGAGTDQGTGVAVAGTGVYITGNFTNNAANVNTVTFGGVALPGSGTTSNIDVFLTKYLDAGSTASVAWVQSAGSPLTEQSTGIAVNGARLYLTGFSVGQPAFGSITLANPYGTQLGYGALLNDVSSPLATTVASQRSAFSLYPNPARAAVTVAGLPAYAACQVFDLLGRPVAHVTADATGTATLSLSAGVSPGVYLVRSGTQAARLTVE